MRELIPIGVALLRWSARKSTPEERVAQRIRETGQALVVVHPNFTHDGYWLVVVQDRGCTTAKAEHTTMLGALEDVAQQLGLLEPSWVIREKRVVEHA